jgi:hypothetical protein
LFPKIARRLLDVSQQAVNKGEQQKMSVMQNFGRTSA